MAKMGRKAEPRYWQRGGGAYWITVGGKKYCLARGPDDKHEAGPTYRAALDAWAQLRVKTDWQGTDNLTLAGVQAHYLEHLRANKPQLLGHFHSWCHSFFEMHGSLRVMDLKPRHVDAWLATRTTWGPTSRNNALNRLMACFSWAAKSGNTRTNPLAGRLDKPTPRVRGRAARMPDGLIAVLLDEDMDEDLRFFLRVLSESGARPIELIRADVVNYHAGKIVHHADAQPPAYRHKNARTGKDRVIRLLPQTAEELERRLGGRKTGPLFLTNKARRFNMDTLKKRFWTLLARPRVKEFMAANGIKRKDTILYGFRHAFISRLLDRGMPTFDVAELAGTSVSKIERVYGHLHQDALGDRFLRLMQLDS